MVEAEEGRGGRKHTRTAKKFCPHHTEAASTDAGQRTGSRTLDQVDLTTAQDHQVTITLPLAASPCTSLLKMRPHSAYAGPSSSASYPRERPSEGYPAGSSRSSFPRRRSPERGGPSEYGRPRDIPSRSAGGPAARSYPPPGGRASRWGPELPYSSSSSSTSSFGGMSSSPTKGGQGWKAMQEAGGRRRQEERGGSRREADAVDWAEVEAKAREKGFAVPGDIVDECVKNDLRQRDSRLQAFTQLNLL